MRKDTDALWALVWARPDDDAPRHVLADHLLELGDPVGELIALQLLPSLTPAQEQRQRALKTKYLSAWLGPLDDAVVPHTARFKRGFLDACTPRFRDPLHRAASLAHPAWSTVRELVGSDDTLFYEPAFHRVRRADGLGAVGLAALSRQTPPLGLEHVHLRQTDCVDESELRRAICDGPGLPNLRQLTVGPVMRPSGDTIITTGDWGWLLDGALGSRLQHLRFENSPLFSNGFTVGAWRRALATRPQITFEAVLGPCTWLIAPGATELALRPYNPTRHWLGVVELSLADVAPDDFAAIRIYPGPGFTARIRTGLVAALRRLSAVEIVEAVSP